MRTGPDHYTRLNPEPIDVIRAWDLPYAIGNVVKYVARYRNKGGVDDLKKARHYLDLEIEEMERADKFYGVPQCEHLLRDGDIVVWCTLPPGHAGEHGYGGMMELPERAEPQPPQDGTHEDR